MMENKIKQLRKGIFELVILGALEHDSHYGYSLIKTIAKGRDLTINEGTIYPILSRLSKEGLISKEWVESHQGPPRKYYTLSDKGRETLKALNEEFDKLVVLFRNIKSAGKSQKSGKKKKSVSIIKEKKNDK